MEYYQRFIEIAPTERFRNGNVILRYITEIDIEDYIRWMTIENEWRDWDAPWEEDNSAEFIERQRAAVKVSPSAYGKLEIYTLTGRHIGWVSAYNIDGDKNRRAVGIDVVPVEYRGKGYGESALTLFMAYLFETENTLYTQTWSGNAAMIRLAAKIGFIEFERITDLHIVRGKKYDALTFSISRDDFFTRYSV